MAGAVNVTLRSGSGGTPRIPKDGIAGVLYSETVGGVAVLKFVDSAGTVFRISPAVQNITGATTQLQVDSIVAALVALGLATDGR
jgi:hypothetical protein